MAPVAAAAADLSGDTLLTRISVVLTTTATVGQLNTAAVKVGATGFAFARPKSLYVTLIVPKQTSAAALETLAASLHGQPGILVAVAGRQLAVKVLPSSDGTTESADELQHLLPTGFPAAWNVHALAQSNCASRRITMVVPDRFVGPPNPSLFETHLPGHAGEFNAQVINVADPTDEDLHGFDVVATLAAQFDSSLPTGANPFPECLTFVPVNLAGLDAFQAVDVIRQAIQGVAGKVIVNASVGYTITQCGAGNDEPCTPADLDTSMTTVTQNLTSVMQDHIAMRFGAGIEWAQFAMQPAVVQNTLLVQAAGNERVRSADAGVLGEFYPGLRQARLGSPLAIASQLRDLQSLLTNTSLWTSTQSALNFSLDAATITGLEADLADKVTDPISDSNLTVVGATTNALLLADLAVRPTSNEGADLFAVGEKVTGVTHQLNGTSFSAPQVAGLASYLWLLDSTLAAAPVAETLKLIRATSRSTANVANVIDAYGAVLALDARNHNQRIRQALLDVHADGVFDALDLQEFMQVYNNAPEIPNARDYRRYDLNGDGLTGGISTERFDLDAGPLDGNGAPAFGAVDEVIEGYHITFSEGALSDLQILCFFAYSSLYASDNGGQNDQLRTSLLGPDRCVGARMNVQLPAQINSRSSATLTATVQVPGPSGQLVPAANMLVNLTPTCATLSSSTGRTDGNGVIVITVTPTAGCTQVSVTVVARADTGTAALAQQVVSATVSSGPIVLSGTVSVHRKLDQGFEQTMSFTMTVSEVFDNLTVTQITGSFFETLPFNDNGCASALETVNTQIVSGQFFIQGNTNNFSFTTTGTDSLANGFSGQDANGNAICGNNTTEPVNGGFGPVPFVIVRAPDGHITTLDFEAHSVILDFDPPPLFLHSDASGKITEPQ